MSLLMDALNKAEQAKRQSQAADPGADAATTSPPAALTLELTPMMSADEPAPPPQPAATPPALPELPAHLGVLDEEFIAHAATVTPAGKEKKTARPAPAQTPPPAAPPAAAPAAQKTEAPDRQAAQNLFDAKQPRPSLVNKRMAALGLLAILAAAGIGIYFWLQLQPSSGAGLARPAATAPRPPTTPVPPAPLAAPAAPPASAAAATPAAPPAPAAAAARPAASAAPASPAAPPRSEDSPGPVHVSTTAKLTLNPSLASGYEAYMAGKFELAKSEYSAVLKNEPSNLDALHGMAAISLRLGQDAAAEEFYLRAIEADPKDALAQAGLIGLKEQINPFQAETRLNALRAAQPDLPYIHFALGSLYARQNRWNEAQAAFFKAYQGEPDNPDSLFNLAVSLDQLHQPKLALQYYNLAVAAAATRPFSFDKAQVTRRLAELQP